MVTEIEHFRNLISLSVADGKIEESEKVALAKIAFERGIPYERMSIMLKHASEYTYLIPQNMIEREKQLTEMIQFAMVDGEFAKAEYDLIKTVAEKLGFSQQELEQYIKANSNP